MNSELRTQNYLFDLIHSYFFYNNTIQYNSVQFFIVFFFFFFLLVKETPIKSNETPVMGATFYGYAISHPASEETILIIMTQYATFIIVGVGFEPTTYGMSLVYPWQQD